MQTYFKTVLATLILIFVAVETASAQKLPSPDHPLLEKTFKISDFTAEAEILRLEVQNISARHQQLQRRAGRLTTQSDLDTRLDEIFGPRLDRTDNPDTFARIYKNELEVSKRGYSLAAWETLGDHYLRTGRLNEAKAIFFHVQKSVAKKSKRAAVVSKMGEAYFAEGDLKTALNLYYLSLTFNLTRQTLYRYERLAEDTDMRIRDVSVDVEKKTPSACVGFTQDLMPGLKAEDFISISPASDIDISAQGRNICLRGLRHGNTYTVTIRAGVPSLPGPLLRTTQTRTFTVGDMSERIAFASDAFVLPKSADDTIPMRTVNLKELDLALYRINNRNLLKTSLDGTLNQSLYPSSISRIARSDGEKIWQGKMTVPGATASTRNTEVITNVPLSDMLETYEAGIYLLTANKAPDEDKARRRRPSVATQWVLVSDLGLTVFEGKKGLDVIVRSLETTRGVSGTTLTLLARNNKILGKARTDSAGIAHFPPGLIRGAGGNAPALLTAERRKDFNYIQITGAYLDLSDHGVAGRSLQTDMDAYLYTERGVYRPGEKVHLSAMMRGRHAEAVGSMPLTFEVVRPDGTQTYRQTATGDPLGGYHIEIPISASARPGRWYVTAYFDDESTGVGSTWFQVEDFVPQRIKAVLSTETQIAKAGDKMLVKLQGNFLYGPPATGLDGEAHVEIKLDPAPFKGFERYSFGLTDDTFYGDRLSSHEFVTNDAGVAEFIVDFSKIPDTSVPLRTVIKASLYDVSGRPIQGSLEVPLRTRDVELGMKRDPKSSFAEDEKAGFEIVALGRQGKPVADRPIAYEWVREVYDWSWYRQGSQWRTRSTIYSETLEVGEAKTDRNGRLILARTMEGGRYRLEVRDLDGKAVSSQKFYTGWWSASQTPNVPDKLELTLENDSVANSETLNAFVKAPFAGTALVSVLGDGLLYSEAVPLPLEGTKISVKVHKDWGPGAYLAVTAYRPKTNLPSKLPARAMALKWFSVDKEARTADIVIEVPEKVVPRQSITLAIALKDFSGKAGPMRLTIAAVDEGILQLTNFSTPNPVDHYFSQRRLGVAIRDIYGRLILPEEGARGQVRTGGDLQEMAVSGARSAKDEENASGSRTRTVKAVALYKRDVVLDKNGRGEVSLDLPDFNGRLRLMVVGYGATRVGQGEAGLVVRDPVVADLLLPRFLAPSDRAEASLSLHNLSGSPKTITVGIKTSKGIEVAKNASMTITLPDDERRDVTIPIVAKTLGDAEVTLTVTGEGLDDLKRQWDIVVRPAQSFITNRSMEILAPGATTSLSTDLFAGLLDNTGRAGITLASRPEFDVPGLLDDLDRYPYGCTEQLVSRAMPLLYFGEVAEKWQADRKGLSVPRKINHAILGVLDHQRYDGSLAVWSPSGQRHPWVTAYGVDFLTRAQEEGHDVPEAAFKHAVTWLKSYVANPRKGEGYAQAYAWYVLARLGEAKASDLRYYATTQAGSIRTRLGLAHLGAALITLGEREMGDDLFVKAIAAKRPDLVYITDYGSDRRDAAAILALLSEVATDPERLLRLGETLEAEYEGEPWLSTQEQAWLLRATHALSSSSGAKVSVLVDDKAYGPQGEAVRLQLSPADAEKSVLISNTNDAPVRLIKSVRGVPEGPLDPVENGFEIQRTYYSEDGKPIDLGALEQNDLVVVLISGRSLGRGPEETLIVDLLPAGLEIENSALGGDGDASAFKFLPRLNRSEYQAARDDRYVAALNLSGGAKFATAYIARAVTPGTYVHPAVFIEDMYRPKRHARGALGELVVTK
jgi:alpha-2-macroglobulin